MAQAGRTSHMHTTPSHTTSKCSFNFSRGPRGAFGVRSAILALSLVVGAFVAFPAASASAQTPELEVNALAPEITASADLALAAYATYEATGDLGDYLEYAENRAATARLAARQLGYPAFAMIDSWRATSIEHQRAVLTAMSQVGVPYRRNTSIEDTSFDCSGLTSFAWRGGGHDLTRQSGSQISQAERLARDTAKAGDLVHYPGHIMLYLGVGDAIIHSIQTGRTVELDTISGRRRNSVRWGDPTL
jgi:cell wall-associated NlpC family hydrolase